MLLSDLILIRQSDGEIKLIKFEVKLESSLREYDSVVVAVSCDASCCRRRRQRRGGHGLMLDAGRKESVLECRQFGEYWSESRDVFQLLLSDPKVDFGVVGRLCGVFVLCARFLVLGETAADGGGDGGRC